MKPRYAKSLDSTHAGIKEYLEKHGVEVVDCSAAGRVPDLLVKHGQLVGWIEAKSVKKDRPNFTRKQLDWISKTRFAVRIVDNKEDALDFAKTHNGMLTQEQKTSLAIFLMKNSKDLFTTDQVAEAMNV